MPRICSRISEWRRALAAWRFSEPSCFSTSTTMSLTRARFTFEDSSLASARRFLVLNFVTPAASSMMARRSMGLVERISPMRPCSMMAYESGPRPTPMNISWMSRSLPTRPLIRYSLWPERYKRRLTTTSPGFVARTGLSGCFFFRLNLPPGSAVDGAEPSATTCCISEGCAESSERVSVAVSVELDVSLFSVARDAESVAESDAALSITKRAASASSGSSIVMVTSASPSGGRLVVPLKMQSAMRSARSDLWLCSPRTQEMASTTLDLPQPFGPTMHVVPDPLNVTTVRSQNDLKPTISTFRSFSKMSPLSLKSRQNTFDANNNRSVYPGPVAIESEERRRYIPRGEGLSSVERIPRKQKSPENVWQVLSQRPSRLAQGWRYGKKQ